MSVIGTFGVMYLCDYSLNNLSLMALTISTGFVVDDAIVVTETWRATSKPALPPGGDAAWGAPDRLYDPFDHAVALGGVHSHPAHAGHRRAAVSRVRGDAEHRGGVFGGGVADADADDVRPPAASRERRRTRKAGWPARWSEALQRSCTCTMSGWSGCCDISGRCWP